MLVAFEVEQLEQAAETTSTAAPDDEVHEMETGMLPVSEKPPTLKTA